VLVVRPAIALLISSFLSVGCAHEVQWLGEEPTELQSPAVPFPMTVAVGVRSFESERLKENGVVEHFARTIREAKLFQAVMYPLPPGVQPRWEIQLLARDSASEPDSNFWKAAIASALLPVSFFIWMESDYTLELEALMVHRSEIVGSYQTLGSIRFRYQINTNTGRAEAEGVDRLLRATAQTVLAALAEDLPRIQAEHPL